MSLLWSSFGSSSAFRGRFSAPRRIALGVAFTLSFAVPGAAQQGTGGSGGSGGTGGGGGSGGALTGAGGSDDGAACMTAESNECTERCPTFDTCFLTGGSEDRLYYRVDDQRFDCDGLDCDAAALRKNDYCCQRGEFAPDEDDGDGGCALPSVPGEHSGGSAAWLGVALGIGALSLSRARRRRQQQRS